jgi:phenylacetate-CoA ligase
MSRLRYATQALNTMSEEEVRDYQWSRLRRQIDYCIGNSAFYRRRFDELGIDPRDIRSLDDFQRLPIIMNKEQERRAQQESLEKSNHPYGAHLSCAPEDVAITATTSGTTASRPSPTRWPAMTSGC